MTLLRKTPFLLRLRAVALILAALCAVPMPATAKDVALTVIIGSGPPMTFEMSELTDMPRTEIVTSTVWTAGQIRFAGVRLHDLMTTVDAKGAKLRAVALNDYAMEIPMTDAAPDGPIIAYEMDGKPMSVREKGPLWIIYPYDSEQRFRTETIYGRSVWQLVRIEVQD
ncbi:MAG: hypothetical protein ACJAVR_000223 [Paracoccaceae bacterium]|jgi:hypothetical protein